MNGYMIYEPPPPGHICEPPACSECDQPIYEGEESVAWADAQGVGVRHSTCPARSRGTVTL